MILDDHLRYYNKDFKIINESDTVRDVINHQLVTLTKDKLHQMGVKYHL